MAGIYDFSVRDIAGKRVKLDRYRGKVLLIVNTASACGFTPQYEGLQTLYGELSDRGLEILAFPCNQFGEQEPAGADEIADFCERNFGVGFPLFSKVDVNGDTAAPLFTWLKAQKPGLLGTEAIKWNFTKFLVDREGNVAARFAPNDTPQAIRPAIEALL
ncbi:MAG TPA: glutathione peroxidase [Casimicrobiaceae bacterium]|nr:glutathione peroxidase [Casimicrobiaceae bacterium]